MLQIFKMLPILLFSLHAIAFEVQFVGPCSKQPLLSEEVKFAPNMNAGEITIAVLDAHKIPYQGTTSGLNQVYNTAIGLDAMEVISNQEMMAYGWCFEVDGQIPEVFADKFPIEPGTKVVRWFYGYAHYLNGEWISQCEKSYLRHPTAFCN